MRRIVTKCVYIKMIISKTSNGIVCEIQCTMYIKPTMTFHTFRVILNINKNR